MNVGASSTRPDVFIVRAAHLHAVRQKWTFFSVHGVGWVGGSRTPSPRPPPAVASAQTLASRRKFACVLVQPHLHTMRPDAAGVRPGDTFFAREPKTKRSLHSMPPPFSRLFSAFHLVFSSFTSFYLFFTEFSLISSSFN